MLRTVVFIADKQVESAYGSLREQLEAKTVEPTVTLSKPNLKLPEPPTFSGKDPELWEFQLHAYFEYLQPTDAEQLQVAILLLRGKAATWYRTYRLSKPTPSSLSKFLNLVKTSDSIRKARDKIAALR